MRFPRLFMCHLAAKSLTATTDHFLCVLALKVHESIFIENTKSMKSNLFFCHTQMYPKIIFSNNFWKLFIPIYNLPKILIFCPKTKLQRLTALLVLKINHQWRRTFFLVTLKSSKKSYFPPKGTFNSSLRLSQNFNFFGKS